MIKKRPTVTSQSYLDEPAPGHDVLVLELGQELDLVQQLRVLLTCC